MKGGKVGSGNLDIAIISESITANTSVAPRHDIVDVKLLSQ